MLFVLTVIFISIAGIRRQFRFPQGTGRMSFAEHIILVQISQGFYLELQAPLLKFCKSLKMRFVDSCGPVDCVITGRS
jgi:hypothetical protein